MFFDSNSVRINRHLITKAISDQVEAITVKEIIVKDNTHEDSATYTKLVSKHNNRILFSFDESLVHPISSTFILVEKLGTVQQFQLAILDDQDIEYIDLINLDTNSLFDDYEIVISVREAKPYLVLIELSTRFITLNLISHELKEVLDQEIVKDIIDS